MFKMSSPLRLLVVLLVILLSVDISQQCWFSRRSSYRVNNPPQIPRWFQQFFDQVKKDKKLKNEQIQLLRQQLERAGNESSHLQQQLSSKERELQETRSNLASVERQLKECSTGNVSHYFIKTINLIFL